MQNEGTDERTLTALLKVAMKYRKSLEYHSFNIPEPFPFEKECLINCSIAIASKMLLDSDNVRPRESGLFDASLCVN